MARHHAGDTGRLGDPRPSARPRRGVGSWVWVIASSAVLGLGVIGVGATEPCSQFHRAVQLSGSDGRFGPWISTCIPDLDAARATLGWDVVLIVGYVGLFVGIIRRWWPLYDSPRLVGAARPLMGGAVLAGVLDLIENVLTVIVLDVRFDPVLGSERFALPDTMTVPVLIATAAWLKWIVLAVVVVASSMALVLAVVRAPERTSSRPDASDSGAFDAGTGPSPVAGGLGVCCSGGGIRSAAFSLGALERLEAAGVLDRTRWLSAVSGGNYAATAWRLVRAADPDRPAAPDVITWLREPVPGSPAGRHRFLRNGPGGLARPIGAAALYVSFNLAVLAALVFAFAWPVGRVLGSPAVQPGLRTRDRLPEGLDVPAELWLPGVVLFAAAVIALAVSALPTWRLHVVAWRLTVLCMVAGLVLSMFLVVLPIAMVEVGRWMTGGSAAVRPVGVGIATLLGVAATVWRLASRTVIDRLTVRLPQLGGVLLVVAAVVWGGKVATDSAVGAGAFADVRWWIAVVVAFVAVYVAVDTSEISLHRIYRKRLRRTFGLARRCQVDSEVGRAGQAIGAVYSPDTMGQPRWEDPTLVDTLPELVVCCAQQRTGIAPGGLPAETFTISARCVRMGELEVDTATYLSRCPERSRRVVTWTATSGAALASAMGRLSQGSTNALLAALNLGLGTWLPNPRLVADPSIRLGRVRLGYLFKEILGWYDPSDRFVYVSDGGHWENLGLVELFRRRCDTIVCIDASGDQVGAFTTLRQAVELAALELPEVVDSIDLTGLDRISGLDGALPGGLVARLIVRYRPLAPGGETPPPAVVLYAKAQMASDLDIALRRYAKVDPMFPNYSTGNQFLSDERFDRLVDLGRAAGEQLLTHAELDAAALGAPTDHSNGVSENSSSTETST